MREVEDTGCGMDEQTQARIFDPFFSTKAQGTGLGLPLTHQIVDEHGGEITCRSQQGIGTVFEITLNVETSADVHSNRD